MFKKVLFTGLCFLMIYSTAVVGYRIFEPQLDTHSPDEQAYIEYDTLNDYVLSGSEGAIYYLFFYSKINSDCAYVKNTVLNIVQNETKLEINKLIDTVDITELERSMSVSRLSSEWGINSYPAFAAVSIHDGIPQVDSKLEWNNDDMLNALDIELWLIENGLYIGTAQDIEPVETPE